MKKVLKKLRKIILNIITILITLILILLIYYFVQISILNKKYVNIFGYSIFQVATGSMSGTIEIGDVVIVKLTTDVQKDDIIVFEQNENFITHRIIDITDNEITTKGDANNSEDEPITIDDVLGKVVKVIPNVGIWQEIIKTPMVAISGIITIVLFVLAFSYKDNLEEESTEKIEEEILDDETKNKKEEKRKDSNKQKN